MTITPEQRRILRHAVGLDNPRNIRREMYRDHYVPGLGNSAERECERMVELGLMTKGSSCGEHTGFAYHVTPAGKKLVRPQFVRRTTIPDGAALFLPEEQQKIDDLVGALAKVVEANPKLRGVDIVIRRTKRGLSREISVMQRA